jgi:hypothetical protein
VSKGIAFTLSVLSFLNYLVAVAIVDGNGYSDDSRFQFFHRTWTLDVRSSEPAAALVVRHWHTVNTADFLFSADYSCITMLAIGPMLIMYLCYRLGVVRTTVDQKSKPDSYQPSA